MRVISKRLALLALPAALLAAGPLTAPLAAQSHNELFAEAKEYADAADAGDADARAHLGEYYENGWGMDANLETAVDLYKSSATLGSSYGAAQLERLGIENDQITDPAYAAYLRKDYKEAVRIWKIRVNSDPATWEIAQSITNSTYNLGMAYKDGAGVDKDMAEARRYFENAARNDHVDAQIELGHIYYFGRGTPVDYLQAAIQYGEAMEAGSLEGQYQFAIMLDEGLGVPQDKNLALIMYNDGAERGHNESKRAVAHFEFLEKKAEADARFEALGRAAQYFYEMKVQAAKDDEARRAACYSPIGNSSHVYQQAAKRGYTITVIRPAGCS